MAPRFPRSNEGGRGASYYSSVTGLATTVAFVVAILATPPIHDLTAEPLASYLTRAYSESVAGLLLKLSFLAEMLLIFFSARAMASCALAWLGLSLLSRGLALV